jgi:hypothetical protein
MHCELLSQFSIQTPAATCTPLNTCNTLTHSPSRLGLISETNWRSDTQHPVLCSDRRTIRLYRTTPYRIGRGSLSDTALRKGCTPLPELMHRSFNNRTVILNVVSWPNYCQTVAILQNVTVTVTAGNSGKRTASRLQCKR